MFDVLTYYLSNGMRVMLHREKGTRIVKVGIVINQGSIYERDDDNGISHFIEHMVMAQYENNDKIKQLQNRLFLYGASYNATTYKTNTMYYISGLAEGMETYLELLRKLVFDVESFDDETLHREKQIVERELVSFYSSFNQIADRSVQALYGERNIGRTIVGKKKNIRSFSVEDVYNKMKNSYVPGNAAIVVYGDVDYYKTENLINNIYGDIVDIKTNISAELVRQTPSIYFNPKYQGEHTIVSVCYRKIVNGDTNIFEDSLLILFATMADPTLSKRIAYKLRYETGLSYNVSGFIKNVKPTLASGITAVAKNEDIPIVVEMMLDELKKIRDEGFNEKELERVKKNIVYRKLAEKGNITNQADVLLKLAMDPLIYSPENEIRLIENISLNDINKCINIILDDDNFGLACIGNCDIDKVVKKFKV